MSDFVGVISRINPIILGRYLTAVDLLRLRTVSQLCLSFVEEICKIGVKYFDAEMLSLNQHLRLFLRFFPLIRKDKIYVIGGYSDAYKVASLEIDYCSGKHLWDVDYPEMIACRYDFSATYFHGEIFITSQSNAYASEVGTTDRFDLKKKTWTRLNSRFSGQESLHEQRIQAFKDKLYVSGGWDLLSVEGQEDDSTTVNVSMSRITYELIEADPDRRAAAYWNPLSVALNQPRGKHASIEHKGALFVGGGLSLLSAPDGAVVDLRQDLLNSVETFDGERWRLLEAKMARARLGNSFLFFEFRGDLFAAGGEDIPGDESETDVFSIEKLNSKTNSWEIVFEDRSFQRKSSCCVNCGTLLYVFGGGTDFNGLHNHSFSCFDLTQNKWRPDLSDRLMPMDESTGYWKNGGDAKAVYIPGASYFYSRI